MSEKAEPLGDDPASQLEANAAKLRALAARRLSEGDLDAATHLLVMARGLELDAQKQRSGRLEGPANSESGIR